MANPVVIDHPAQKLHSSPPGGTDTDKPRYHLIYDTLRQTKRQQPACLCLSGSNPSDGHQWNYRWGNLSKVCTYAAKFGT